MTRGWTSAGAATTALVLFAFAGGIGPSSAVESPRASQPNPSAATAADQASRPAADRRESTFLLPESLSATAPGTSGGKASAGPTAALAFAGPFASRRGALPGSVVVLSATQQLALQERSGNVPEHVHRGPLEGIDVVMDHPVAGPFSLSSAFGWRINPTDVGPALQFHIGQDYAVACGTPVRAAADGTVRFAGDRGTSGLRVDIDHASGLATAYHHNSVLLVSPGDTVARGDVIALAGTTGNSTGCHIHFGLTLHGRYVEPSLALPAVAGQPKSLSDKDLARIRAAARTAPTGLTGPTTTASGPKIGSAAPDGDRSSANETPRKTPSDPSDPSENSTPRKSGESGKPSTPKTRVTTGSPTAEPKPKVATKPKPKPTAPSPTPKPTAPVPQPTTPDPTSSPTPEPNEPAPAVPTPTEPPLTDPTPSPTPEPTEPSLTEPPLTDPTPSPTPEPTEPVPSEPTPSEPSPTEPDPQPTTPVDPEPSDDPTGEPAPPATLTAAEAARWCVDLGDEYPDGETLTITEQTVLTEVIAILGTAGEPEFIDEGTLAAVDPTAAWLESLPACSDEEFLADAKEARTAG